MNCMPLDPRSTCRRALSGVAVLTILAIGAVGCGTMSVPPDKVSGVDSYPVRASQQGLTIAVHPVSSQHELDEVFNMNLLKRGVLPVLIVAENRNGASSFIIQRENVKVGTAVDRASSIGPRAAVATPDSGNGTAVAGGVVMIASPIVGAPFLFAGLKMASDSYVVEYNMADKELYSHTLAPGQQAHGYVYVSVPAKAPPSDLHVFIVATDSATGRSSTFDLPISPVSMP